MFRDFSVFPNEASTLAPRVDALFFFLLGVSLFFIVSIFASVVYFAIKYRRRPGLEPKQIAGSLKLELLWSGIPLLIAMVMFGWGTSIYMSASRPPSGSLEILVVAKQWMWKFQQPTGQREIDELHVPVGRPIKLTMTSEDVIHSFFVPAFRVKADVIPGRYRTTWFQATKVGSYHLFCSQYCGTQHSNMVGTIYVMEPGDYQAWLGGGTTQGAPATQGAKLFQQYACHTCHMPDGTGRGPSLVGIYDQPVELANGRTVTANEGYLRESIVNPQAGIVAGYGPIMPTFQGVVNEEGLMQLVEYIKSLAAPQRRQPAAQTVPAPVAAQEQTAPETGGKRQP